MIIHLNKVGADDLGYFFNDSNSKAYIWSQKCSLELVSRLPCTYMFVLYILKQPLTKGMQPDTTLLISEKIGKV